LDNFYFFTQTQLFGVLGIDSKPNLLMYYVIRTVLGPNLIAMPIVRSLATKAASNATSRITSQQYFYSVAPRRIIYTVIFHHGRTFNEFYSNDA